MRHHFVKTYESMKKHGPPPCEMKNVGKRRAAAAMLAVSEHVCAAERAMDVISNAHNSHAVARRRCFFGQQSAAEPCRSRPTANWDGQRGAVRRARVARAARRRRVCSVVASLNVACGAFVHKRERPRGTIPCRTTISCGSLNLFQHITSGVWLFVPMDGSVRVRRPLVSRCCTRRHGSSAQDL